MIGRLLHLGSGGPAETLAESHITKTCGPILSLESVQEDIHTRNLLFPDAQALYQHRNDQVFPLSSTSTLPVALAANTFDYSEDVDLDVKDVRIIVMQDALGPANASLLFDSHPPPEPLAVSERSPARHDTRRAPGPTRKSSLTQSARPLVVQAESPQARTGAFDRRESVHGRAQSYTETEAQRAAREYREELATFSSCIFGNSELMAYKGTSTKVHVVPGDSRTSESAASSVFGDGRSSIGRSSGRSSKLSQSHSSQAVSPTSAMTHHLGNVALSRPSDKRKVLITRLFPVNLNADEAEADNTLQTPTSEQGAGFPFPATSEESVLKQKKAQPKQRRTPMYAVVLVINIPQASPKASSLMTSRTAIFRESGSFNDQDLFSSSYNSSRAGWNMSGSGAYGDADSSDIEDRIDSLTRHWDIIMRTLTHLQSVFAIKIHFMLRQADCASPGSNVASSGLHIISRTSSMSDRRPGDLPRAKPSKSTTKLVYLLPNCLADDAVVASEVGLARSRIVMGLSAARVVTGQGRWGIWRDEAIWTSKWATSVDRSAFFHNLLTGFLSTHTDWMQALCGPSYRKRAALARRNKNEEDVSLPARTILICDDKMAARRLVFLLSAFLPSNSQMPTTRVHRSSASASVGAYSHSPPTLVIPVLREESLRRRINRRTGLRRASYSRTVSQNTRTSAVVPLQGSIDRHHQRRASDAASIRTTNLPLPGTDAVTRKSSAATTTTIMPETTAPHFTSAQQREDQRRQRLGSSGSLAADDLKRSLKRGDSSGQVGGAVSRPPSSVIKWGSLIGGLWNTRRRESIDSGTFSQGSVEFRSPSKNNFAREDKLSEIPPSSSRNRVQSLAAVSQEAGEVELRRDSFCGPRGRGSFARGDRTPDPNSAYESPVKTSIDAKDGIIDVDVPFPDYIASFESAISSPSSSGYLSNPGLPSGLEAFEQTRFTIDGDVPLNAAGWLNRFHPDFALQALPPQDNLIEKIKSAMRAEPTPVASNVEANDLSERWVDVSVVLVADATTNTVNRIIYRRLVRGKTPGMQSHNSASGGDNALSSPPSLPYDMKMEEEWVEEPIFTCDDTLKEAVDKVIDPNGNINSKGSSTNSSQTPSDIHGSAESHDVIPNTLSELTQSAQPPFDAPRTQCKTVILSALEELFREAVDEQDASHMSSEQDKRNSMRKSLLRDAVKDWVISMNTVA